MVSKGVTAGIVLLTVVASTPAFAQEGRRRSGEDRTDRVEQRASQSRAVPRSRETTRSSPQRYQDEARRHDDGRSERGWSSDRRSDDRRPDNRQFNSRQFDNRRYADRRFDNNRFDNRRFDNRRYVNGRYYYPNSRVYAGRPFIAPRIVRPRIVTVLPYRPYYYRPRLSIGVYYGVGNAYPYGYTPDHYYNPVPGGVYGGVRITDAPRDARVFADGYYVGIVDDFDGVFQHVNLEAGERRIEIQAPGYEPIAFDVLVQPGRTITLRGDLY